MPEPVEETRIDPYYRGQGKFLVNTLFDKGLLSESLSRDGMDRIEDLVALMFQHHANTAKSCAKFIKLYKGQERPEGQERHEEEMQWIARAKKAEHQVSILEAQRETSARVTAWIMEVGVFLDKILVPLLGSIYTHDAIRKTARKLVDMGVAEGIFPGNGGIKIGECSAPR